MITWQGIINAANINGSAPSVIGETAFQMYGPGGGFETATINDDWFGGNLATTVVDVSLSSFILASERLVEADPTDTDAVNSFFQTFGADGTVLISNGNTTSSFQAFTVSFLDDVRDEGDAGLTQFFSGGDTDWSRITTNLQSYSLFTETVLGLVTTTSVREESFRTTTSAGELVTTTFSERDVTFTTVSDDDFEFATWRASAYETTYFTGQTTAVFYSAFANEVPLTLNSGSVAETTVSLIEPLVFSELQGIDPTNNLQADAIIVSAGASYEATKTNTTQGSIVEFGESGPSVTGGGSKFSSETISAATLQPAAASFSYYALATVTEQYATTSHVALADVSNNATFSSTQTYETAEEDTYATLREVSPLLDESLTITGSFIVAKQRPFTTFATNSAATVANFIGVGVRAASGQSAGASIESEGQANKFSQHASSIFLAASKSTQDSNGSSTWFANSYTFKNTTGGETQSVFGAAGQSVNQWMPASAEVGEATILGGNLPANAVVLPGIYATHEGSQSSTVSISEPIETSWTAGQSTTAYRRMSFATFLGDSAVLATSRNPVTIIDD
jgi:hypothetical protein